MNDGLLVMILSKIKKLLSFNEQARSKFELLDSQTSLIMSEVSQTQGLVDGVESLQTETKTLINSSTQSISTKIDSMLSTQASRSQPHGVSIFSTAGTHNWTCPTDVHIVTVIAVGGGGGGGGGGCGAICSTTSGQWSGGGGGAGGGSGAIRVITQPVTPGTKYTVTVGAGGAGGAKGIVSKVSYKDNLLAQQNALGANGGDTTFLGVTAKGGEGGSGGGGGAHYNHVQKADGGYRGDGGYVVNIANTGDLFAKSGTNGTNGSEGAGGNGTLMTGGAGGKGGTYYSYGGAGGAGGKGGSSAPSTIATATNGVAGSAGGAGKVTIVW